ncbi:MAG TPA: thioredoxin family protein [Gemmataceae bacterium]|nr:thioredoxin family protein [Gemmataceae bacterium]
MFRPFAVSVLLIVGLAGSFDAAQDEFKIGDTAPEFKNLPGIDGKAHSSGDFKRDVLVVVITTNHCPVAMMYEERVINFTKKYATGKDAKVDIVAINVNNLEEDKLDAMKAHAKKKEFNFPYLYDQSQAIAKKLNTHVTPEFYVFDKNRKLVYWGAMDDNMDESKITERYLVPAVDAVLAGKAVTNTKTKAFGCLVQYEK